MVCIDPVWVTPIATEHSMPNPILVTGATGNIGRELVKQLKAAGAHVIAGSPSGESVARLVETRHVDFVDPASLKRAFQGIDTLFLLFPLQANMVELARNAVPLPRPPA